MINSSNDHHLSQRAHLWRIFPPHAMMAALLCWTAFVIVAALVATGRSEVIDRAGLLVWRHGEALEPAGSHSLIEGVRDVTAMGGVLLRNLFALAALTALLLLRLRREALLLAATITGGWMVNSLLKLIVGRPRPIIVPHLTEAGGQSFPSGHSFNSAVVYIAIALAFAAMTPRRAIRWTLIGAAMMLSAAIALSRVWLGVHFPSDVLAGWLGGAGWAFMAAAIVYRPAKTIAKTSDAILDRVASGD